MSHLLVMMNRSKPTKKLILAACNKHDHPLPYLKGVKYADLVSVLQVKGLTQNGSNLMPTNVQHEKPKKLKQPSSKFFSSKTISPSTSLHRLDPPLGPPLTPGEICWRMCLQSHLKTSLPNPKNCKVSEP